jgi:hypothetical protein
MDPVISREEFFNHLETILWMKCKKKKVSIRSFSFHSFFMYSFWLSFPSEYEKSVIETVPDVASLGMECTWKPSNHLWVGVEQIVPTQLYVRPAVSKLWTDLYAWIMSESNRVAVVHGCPGTGKSTEVMEFALSQTKSKSVTWIHFASVNICKVKIFTPEEKAVFCEKFESTSQSQNVLRILNTMDSCDLLVLDGHVAVSDLAVQCKHKKVLFCVSYSALPTTQALRCMLRTYVFPSWSKHDLRGAISKGCLGIPTDLDFESIFSIVGGSMRLWQLVCSGKQTLEAMKEILFNLQLSVPQMRDLFRVGPQSASAVNSLQSVRLGKMGTPISEPLSQYVFDLYIQSINFDSFKEYYSVANGYRACIGWCSR